MVAAVVGSMMAKRVDGSVGGDVADGLGGGHPLGIALTLIFLWKRQLSAGALRSERNALRDASAPPTTMTASANSAAVFILPP